MTTNERLRGSLVSARLSPSVLAERIGVDPKTVERWITKGRLPHRTHRVAVSGALEVDEAYLWPESLIQQAARSTSTTELLEVYSTRASVPHDVWQQMFTSAREAMDILIYAGTFLFEQHDIVEVLRAKSQAGVPCRFLIADETSDAVRIRAQEEGTAGGLQGRIQLHRRYLRDVASLPGIQVRTHATTLYNSLFRFDRDLLVNGHAYGAPPVIRPSCTSGGYRASGCGSTSCARSTRSGYPESRARESADRMGRIDYYHDPDAPRANSIVPSTTVAVRDERGHLLMIHKVDNDKWALPGGGMDIGESIAAGAEREVLEETGLTVEITGLVGIYTDPGHVMAYDDGEVRQQFSVCFHARPPAAHCARTAARPRRLGG